MPETTTPACPSDVEEKKGARTFGLLLMYLWCNFDVFVDGLAVFLYCCGMSVTPYKKAGTKLSRAATLIEEDIRARNLMPGDRYLSVEEVVEVVGLSPATCHRAMKLLAERNLLRRRRNLGTFIGEAAAPQDLPRGNVIYVLLSPDRQLGALSRGSLMDGLWRALPEASLQFLILPTEEEGAFIKNFIATIQAAGTLASIVAVSCSREAYAALRSVPVPVVVIGSVAPGEDQLISIDGDEKQAGWLLAKNFVDDGHRQFAVLMNEIWRPGDNLFLEGVQEALAEARLSVAALRVCALPDDQCLFDGQVRPLLREHHGPLGVICEGEWALRRLEELKGRDPSIDWRQLDVAVHVDAEMPDHDVRYPCTYQQVSVLEMSAMAGEIIVSLQRQRPILKRQILLPMALSQGVSAKLGDIQCAE